jgi:RNA polymerase sigma-70 factor (ECF subfamily)
MDGNCTKFNADAGIRRRNHPVVCFLLDWLRSPTERDIDMDDGFQQQLLTLLPEIQIHAQKLTRDRVAAEDLAQASIERALRFRAQYKAGTHLRAWMYTLTHRLFVTHYRKIRRERRCLERCAHERFATSDPDIRTLSNRTQLALANLTKDQRDLMLLVDFLDYSYAEAAKSLEIPEGTVMSRLFRARKSVRKQLGEDAR